MKKYNAKEFFSIPNIMCYFRILMIPVFSYLYITAESPAGYYTAAAVVLISSLTDLFDGRIARCFNMITELGKALDPVADKLTHAALAFCLATRYPLMWALIVLMAVKEGYMALMGLKFLRFGRKLDGAMWYGKVCTASLFVLLFFLFIVVDMPLFLTNILIAATMVIMFFTLCMYVPEFGRMKEQLRREGKEI